MKRKRKREKNSAAAISDFSPATGNQKRGHSSIFWYSAIAIFILAVTMRGLFLYEDSRQPTFNLFYMDEEYNLEWARALSSGEWNAPYDMLTQGPYFRAPLYSHFLAGLFRIFGPGTLLPRIVQIIIGSLSCVLAHMLATRSCGQRVGLVTGLLCSVYWVLIYFDVEFLLPVLLVFLALSGLLLLLYAWELRSRILAFSAGIVFGLYAITRPNILVFFPFALWWIWKSSKSSALRMRVAMIFLFGLGFALPPGLVTVRNAVVGDDLVVVSSQGGVNFYIGNNEQSNGIEAIVPGTRHTWWGGYQDAVELAENARGRQLKASEVSSYWFGKGLDYIREHPLDWARLMGRKIIALVGDAEIANNEPYESRKIRYRTLSLFPLGFAFLAAGFFAATLLTFSAHMRTFFRSEKAVICRREPLELLVLFMGIYAITIILFFVTGRYRIPIIPIMIIGTSIALVRLFDLVHKRRLRAALMLFILLGGITAILRIDWLDIRDSSKGFAAFAEAQDELDTGEIDEGVAKLEELRQNGAFRLVALYSTLARARISRNAPGDLEAAFNVAEEGLRIFPCDTELLWYSAVGHVQRKNWVVVRDRIDRYLLNKPHDMRALFLAFDASLAVDDTAAACSYLSASRDVDPEHPAVKGMENRLQLIRSPLKK